MLAGRYVRESEQIPFLALGADGICPFLVAELKAGFAVPVEFASRPIAHASLTGAFGAPVLTISIERRQAALLLYPSLDTAIVSWLAARKRQRHCGLGRSEIT